MSGYDLREFDRESRPDETVTVGTNRVAVMVHDADSGDRLHDWKNQQNQRIKWYFGTVNVNLTDEDDRELRRFMDKWLIQKRIANGPE